MSDKDDLNFNEVDEQGNELFDENSKKEENDDDKDGYEEYCYLCHRPQSIAGRLIHMPNDICICQDCMQKTFDGLAGGNIQFMDMSNFDLSRLSDMWMGKTPKVKPQKQKKKKEPVEVDIKPMIRSIEFTPEEETLFVTAVLDSGSVSNLSPELVIDTLLKCLQLNIDRSEIAVMRKKIILEKNNHQ